MKELVNKEMIISYLRYLMKTSDLLKNIPIYKDIVLPVYKQQNRDYEGCDLRDDTNILLELIAENKLANEYIQEIIEFSIANL